MGCTHQLHQGKAYVFDLETDGLYNECSKIHCLVLKDIHSNVVQTFSDDVHCNGTLDAGLTLLENADLIIGHNIIGFDLNVIDKVSQIGFTSFAKGEVFDTLVASRLIWSDIYDIDAANQKYQLPSKLWGSHSLKAWGIRLGNQKQEIETDWSKLTKEMLDYCIQDVHATHTLYQKILNKKYSEQALKLEHNVAKIINKQELYGIQFDNKKASELYASLSEKRSKIRQQLQQVFPPIEEKTEFVPKVNNKSKGYIKGQPFTKIKVIEFNPSSRQHIASRLKEMGWKPKEFTPDGSPKVDDKVLNKLDYPEAKLLAEYFMLEKRLGMLGDGQQAYMKLEKEGRIHGTVNTNGAVTGRSTARNPNLQQVPAVHAPYGKEFRELFAVPKDKKMVGIDMSGIEVRCLAHYLAKYDDGEYAKIVLEGDIHSANQKAAGLENRDLAKRFFYCWLYGGGVGRIAEVTGKTKKEAKAVKERFLNRMPALARLIKDVHKASERGYLIGLDKRVVKVRNTFSSLNTLLQSAGAITAKQWLVEFKSSIEDGLPSWEDVWQTKQLLWIHDEIQVEAPVNLADRVGELAVKSIKKSGEYFNMRVPLTGEYKIGNNWSETH